MRRKYAKTSATTASGTGRSSFFTLRPIVVGATIMVLCSGCEALVPLMAPVVSEVMKDPGTRAKVIDTTTGAATNAWAWGKNASTNAVAWAKEQMEDSESTQQGLGGEFLAVVEKHPTHFVSVKRATLRSEPTELSDAVAALAYNTGVKAVEDVTVALPFDGDPDLFPSNLVPHWAKASIGDTTGYLPLSSLADADLMKKQSPDDPIPACSGEADERTVNEILSSRRPLDDGALGAFLRDGNLSGSMPEPVVEALPDAGGGIGASIVSGLRGAWSATAAGASRLVGRSGNSAKDEPVTFDEFGPLQEFQLGRAVAERIAALHRILPAEDPRSVYVAQVGAAVAAASNDPTPFHGYRFAVMDSDEINAFAIPGGFVFVTSGLLDFLESEDELAAVLAREVAHLELRQVLKAIGDEKLLAFFAELKNSPSSSALAETVDEAFELVRDGCGVEAEGVADWRAVQLAARVGYDPRALVDILGRLASADIETSYGGVAYPDARASDVGDYLDALGLADRFFQGADVRKARYEAAVRKE